MIIAHNDLQCCTIYYSPYEGYVTEWDGSLVLEAENNTDLADFQTIDEWIDEYARDNCLICCSDVKYKIAVENNRCTVEICGADGASD